MAAPSARPAPALHQVTATKELRLRLDLRSSWRKPGLEAEAAVACFAPGTESPSGVGQKID